MTALSWDEIGERFYQEGIDRGVLYLQDGQAAPWNGLIGLEDSSEFEVQSFYLDGAKYLETITPGDFVGKLRAYTYPDEFDLVNGLVAAGEGFRVYEQPPKSFNLSYRSKLGNDVDGSDLGYKIHILYNLIAKPESHSFDTADESGIHPVEFNWTLTGTPAKLHNIRPAVHITIDSTKTDPIILQMIEDQLYGNDLSDPSLPTLEAIAEYFGFLGALVIVDHGDGTWSAIDESGGYITMLDETSFLIDNADVVIIDTDSYTISSTNI